MKSVNVVMTAAWIALLAGFAVTQVKRVAVVETETDAQSGASANINKAEVRQITAALRREAVNNLPQDRYYIMTSETVIAQGSAVLEECADENCVITLGAKIGADYIVLGTVSKLGTKLTVTVEMYETDDGNLVASSDLAEADNAAALLKAAAAACADMFKKFDSRQSQTRKTPAAPTPPPTPTKPATYTVATAANPVNGGTVSRNPNQTSYAAGTNVTITAIPANGYTFTGWSGASNSKNATLTGPIDRNLTLMANFQYVETYQPPVPTSTTTPTYQQSGGSVSTFTDSRDGKTYKTVVIGGKRWMAENLNYQPQSGKSWCYKNDGSYCDKYGRLYDWNTARTACMSGWHLPSRQEWNDLVKAAGGRKAGKKLRATSFRGTDDYGFSALPGGRRYAGGDFDYAGNYGRWWTATEYGSGYAYYRYMGYNYDNVDEYYLDVGGGFSVRCVAD